ncbi:MAG: bifunctional phosphoribosyl-AMP cyclohydrolase/phosphoribosyl-ATP pyrophosphatase [Thermoplasmata archaeon]|nr:MAG: bifunctional phosphoribosyl-AMP cyclohydrolase/phosphoribosyl-ATP pyrophosphatase [Thermoplasmata archaeon]
MAHDHGQIKNEQVNIRFDERGLVPAVVQDSTTGQVLMVAWMNAEALQRTRETGQAHFWSRSRQELWHKGATSGNVMHVREIWVDCDADTLLLRVDPAGPACHTGEQSCFFRRLDSLSPKIGAAGEGTEGGSALDTLFATILDRQANPRPGSYTAQLLDTGEDEILKKVGEEAMEIILAAKGQGDERLISEVADLFYHLLVLLAARGLTLADVGAELARRRR